MSDVRNFTFDGKTLSRSFPGRAAAEANNPINFRLLKWVVWHRDKKQRTLPPEIEAVEKAVGHLPETAIELKHVITGFYLRNRTIAQIADAMDQSEFHCETYLVRAIRQLGHDIPAWDALLRQQGTRAGGVLQ